eukprot:c22519_g1_i1.p1 GENE.c22519_g1_i1~~c22519_g1_i1.p1  ORF type:complete len:146 (-),score=23.88 c22519_g1_i1:12-419(-)
MASIRSNLLSFFAGVGVVGIFEARRMAKVLDHNASELRSSLGTLQEECKQLNARTERVDKLTAEVSELRADLAGEKKRSNALANELATVKAALQGAVDDVARSVSHLKQDMLEYVPAARVRERTEAVEAHTTQPQ